MLNTINFREVVDFTRYVLLASKELPTPSDFDTLPDIKKSEIYDKIWNAYHEACNYMTSALDMDELHGRYR